MLIRTYYSKGQIFYIGNKNQIDFVSLYLLNGTLGIIYMGADGKADTISSDLTISDGLWHNVSNHAFIGGDIKCSRIVCLF